MKLYNEGAPWALVWVCAGGGGYVVEYAERAPSGRGGRIREQRDLNPPNHDSDSDSLLPSGIIVQIHTTIKIRLSTIILQMFYIPVTSNSIHVFFL